MSEQGWREFVAAEGVEDWVVLHGGATAVFRAGSLVESHDWPRPLRIPQDLRAGAPC
jgi:hypothetical protein